MRALKTLFCSLAVAFMLFVIVPSVAFGQTNDLPKQSVSKANGQPKQSVSKTIIKTPPKSPLIKSLAKTQSYTDATDYPLVTNGQYVDYLYDSYYTVHDIYFGSVSNYSSDKMDIQVTEDSDYYYYKDSIVSIEYYKNNGGVLSYAGYTQFDTYGYYTNYLHSTVPKADFSNQQYIYLRVGLSETEYDTYYSDTTLFKVKNPYYVPPVVDTTPPAKPTVRTISDKDTTVSGTAEANSTVYAKVGTTTIGYGKASSTGSYSFTISPQKAGTIVTFYAKDAAGNVSGNVSVKVIDKTAPAKPTVYSIGDNQTIVIGKTEANAKVVIKAGTTVLGQGTAISTGSFTVKMTAAQKANTSLTVYATDMAGNQSVGTAVKVLDKTPPVAPTVNKVTYLSKSVTGTGEKSSTIYIYKGTALIGKATVDAYGKFNAAIAAQPKGTKLEVISMDSAYNQSKSVYVTVY
ncbi:Ig-like domain-containing protein [Bacillus sp. USDA818B3_A]|uniref:Ig-like domain-containing protein n=1 Tax=Bacillus sp. USDA818B3_A TaxID=2698834 RepID=UPI001370211C|nr:Ig-like domain-containing protein [Bacillus sp. USDA818B3_A]